MDFMKIPKFRIESQGGITHVFNGETGEEIKGLKSMTININPGEILLEFVTTSFNSEVLCEIANDKKAKIHVQEEGLNYE